MIFDLKYNLNFCMINFTIGIIMYACRFVNILKDIKDRKLNSLAPIPLLSSAISWMFNGGEWVLLTSMYNI
jgi:hypothetical protein